jgi:hypothetical protein
MFLLEFCSNEESRAWTCQGSLDSWDRPEISPLVPKEYLLLKDISHVLGFVGELRDASKTFVLF